MGIEKIIESYLLSIACEQKALYAEFRFLREDNQKCKLYACNKDTTPIRVEFEGLSIKAGLSSCEGIPVLGEIEAAEATANGFELEGDNGLIKVVADNWWIEDVL